MTKRTNYFMSSLCLISQIPNITTQLEKQIAFFEKPFTLVAKILHRKYFTASNLSEGHSLNSTHVALMTNHIYKIFVEDKHKTLIIVKFQSFSVGFHIFNHLF